MALEWYIVRVLTNSEDRVRDNLDRRIKADGLEGRMPQVLVPVEKVTEISNGKKRVVSRKLYPGYLLLQADLGDWEGADRPGKPEDQAVWFALHETQGFGDFVEAFQIFVENGLQQIDSLIAGSLGVGFEGPFRSSDSNIDIGSRSKADSSAHFFGRRINDVQRIRGNRVDPFTVDIELQHVTHRFS